MISSSLAVRHGRVEQFQTSYEEFNQGARQTIQGLEGMYQYLHAAADAFDQTYQQLSQQLGR